MNTYHDISETESPAFRYGERLMAASLGFTPSHYAMEKAAHERLYEDGGDASYRRKLCKWAAAAYEATGDGNSFMGILFTKLAQHREWVPELDAFPAAVERALGSLNMASKEEEMDKQAAAAAVVPLLAANEKSGVGALGRLLLGAGALGGAGIGSLAFFLSRNARQTSAYNQELLERARAYKKLQREIEEDMAVQEALANSKSKSEKTRYAL